MRKVLYLGWIGFNNLGDEWMWEMFRAMADAHLNEEEYQIIPSLPQVEWKKVDQYDTIVLGGGSLIIPGYVDLVHDALELGKTIIIWGSGHDRLHKWEQSAEGLLVPDAVNESIQYRQKLKAVMEHSAYCGVRGPWTVNYMDSLGALPEHISISGDSAMLMNALVPVSAPARTDQSQYRTIGINWGTSYNRIYGGNEERVEDALAEAGRSLLALGYRLHLYSVWGPDQEALARLYRKLGHDDHVTFDPNVYTAADYVELLSGFEATINFKLHANLLSAAANVPFVCIGYRFKSFDLMHGLDLADWIIASDDEQLAHKLTEKVQAAAAWREGYISKLDAGRQTAYQSLVTPFRERLF
ncbi:polysaccharide pyruvyl transferase WcaK-like protein [Paenibacillus cellulosilyticus]|uniref:Polysaccharide pyruvyl transferase WcaK-like protein n=1 Tax=Paenibacillus cellulosilyticus TaxID=375489 RepID=A0A2V2YTM3_9BACL|nr:polysaccharide pyruvyl transferase family protein [Paenibacillus cellulosilyticus]PWW02833.1 polysaccharide pyruvyl transferase WcaK-like protein [Paenibacillus cellulosilyticus]QKS45752.1 polysaccharide pyruvyl transferase family protein [Paenibacillus cellulosilyticus]